MPTIAYLADWPQLIEALAADYERQWGDWYGAGKASARDDLRERARRAGLPLGFVALEAGAAIGACALVSQSGRHASDLGPGVGGLWVTPEMRRRGIVSALVARASEEAAAQGHERLYAATHEMDSLFLRLGWQLREVLMVKGKDLSVFETAPLAWSALPE
jgi:predicted N-acetyltransferase YhbS